MNWLFDSPITILLGAVAIGFLLGVAWVQTGKNVFLYSIAGVALAAVGLLVLERTVETDGEKVRKLLYQIAGEIETNDVDAVMQHIISSQPKLAEFAKQEMGRYTFTGVTITKIHSITEFPRKQPPAVVAEFNVLVGVSSRQGDISVDSQPIFFKITFWKDDDGRWKIADYEYDANRPFPKASGDD
jgi:hypothetical protein